MTLCPLFLLVLTSFVISPRAVNCEEDWSFPKDFSLGAATASYQIEGAWNVSDKGKSVWDWFTHKKPWFIVDKSNGDVACDSFHKYKEDIAILKDIGFNYYRFSISWARILPTGFVTTVSKAGIKYYNDLIDEIRSKGLEPFVTIYHWDHPEILEEMGGWTNDLMVEWFTLYSRVVFREFGHKVRFFVTINEPTSFCCDGYGGHVQAPAKNLTLYGDYICMHNVLKAHASVYHMYNTEFREMQNGKIGIALVCRYGFAKNKSDTSTVDIAFQYNCGWAAHPIFSKTGDYPEIMRERIDENSRIQGWPMSRLPKFTQKEIDFIRGSADFFALNHYTSFIAIPVPRKNGAIWENDSGLYETTDPKWPTAASSWLKVVPDGFGNILRKIKEEYDNPMVYITENGFSDRDGLNDTGRLNYYYSYMKEMLMAIKDGCNVKGYTIWSIIDNFEWERGYTERFGIVHVDFKDVNRKRTYKNSAKWFKDIIRTHKLLPVNNYTYEAEN